MPRVQGKHLLDLRRLAVINNEASSLRGNIVTQWRSSANPLAFPPGRCQFVARPLADNLSLKLRKRQQDIQRQPAQRRRRVELLGDRNKAYTPLVEAFYD